MNDEILAAQVDDLLRSMPAYDALNSYEPVILEWRGRLAAVLDLMDPLYRTKLAHALSNIDIGRAGLYDAGARNLISLLHEARHTLRLRSPTATSLVVNSGAVFEYFDEVRKIITTATTDLFFVDPYINADFVSRYLTQISPGVAVRILSNKNIPALLGAVEIFAQQHGHKIEVRSTPTIHDRYVFLDKRECYQSGASFKDGAKNAPAGIVQIVDAAAAMLLFPSHRSSTKRPSKKRLLILPQENFMAQEIICAMPAPI